MSKPETLNELLITPGTLLVLEVPINQAGMLKKGSTITLRKTDRRKLLDVEVLNVGPGSRPTRRAVQLRVPAE